MMKAWVLHDVGDIRLEEKGLLAMRNKKEDYCKVMMCNE